MQNPDYATLALYIDGEWIEDTKDKGEVLNPANGEVLGLHPMATAEQIDCALASSLKGFEIWRKNATC